LVGIHLDAFALLVGIFLKTNQFESILTAFFNFLGKPLYSKKCHDRKFGTVLRRVLLPKAIDFHVRSHEIEVNEQATEELSNLNGDVEQKDEAIRV